MKPKVPSSINKLIITISVTVALLSSALWSVNRFWGREQFRVILIILLVFFGVLFTIWALVWIFRKIFWWISSAKARREVEKSAHPRAGTTPEEQMALEALQKRLDKAVRALKKSRLAKGKKGDEVLYSVPWILLIGPAGAGKTTALRECGVDFPHTTEDGRSRDSAGAPCDFWFSREAIVLDLAGRIGLDEEGAEVFRGFLGQLKRARRARPLDAIVITVDVSSVISQSSADVERLAGQLRMRCDEMIRHLAVRCPIYILFTKADQIEGFREFFGNLRSSDRKQVWGATISREQRKRQSAGKIFAHEFDRLVESLAAIRLRLLASEKDVRHRAHIYTFPARLASLRNRLAEFVGLILQPTPYSERPLFRGFYFGSASGLSAPVFEAPQIQTRWEPGQRLETAEEKPQTSKTFFLENLFKRVLFADRHQTAATIDTRLRKRIWMDVAFVVTVVLSVSLIVGMLFSFAENRTLIQSTRQAALRLTDAGWDASRTPDLMALEDLRQKVEDLDRFQTDGPPWSLRWGLYSGEPISSAARRVYFRRLRESFVTPTADALRSKLNLLSSDAERAASFDEFYTNLKAYLMMTEPSRAESSFLYNALVDTWKSSAAADTESVVLKQLRFYSEQLPRNDAELQLTQDTAVVNRSRRALSQFPVLLRLYTTLKNEGNAQIQPFTIALATGGKSLDYLDSSHDVPGVFTDMGWSSYFKQAAAEASKAVVRDDWVLGPTYSQVSAGENAGANYESRILDMYYAEYAREWLEFLQGISVRPLADLTEARSALDSFSQQDSAISRLLMNVAAQTMLHREPPAGGSVTSMVSGALATLGLATRVNRSELISAVADQFLPLHELVTSPDGTSPAMSAQYIEYLGKVHAKLESLFGAGGQWEQVKAYIGMIATNISGDEFQDAYRLTARINQMCNTRCTQPINPLLEQPLRQAWAAILRDAGSRLDGLWRTRIAETFKRDVENRFPFNPNGEDLPLSLLSQFLAPGEGSIWAFHENELKTFLSPEENRWVPATLIHAQVDFSPAFLNFLENANALRRAIYGAGGAEPSVRFDLTPQAVPEVTESILEIDGQQLLYRNERALPTAFSWPGKAGAPQSRISIAVTGSGERPGIPTIDGEWGFFRLLRRARLVPRSQTTFSVVWPLNSTDGRRFDIRYKLQARSVQNPFEDNFFSSVRCPDRVTRLPGATF